MAARPQAERESEMSAGLVGSRANELELINKRKVRAAGSRKVANGNRARRNARIGKVPQRRY